jgi:transposase InsO family protein
MFHQWGQPQCLRVDNGLPFGDPGSDLVPVLSLWLIGLGIDVLWNRPYQATDNAKVERMQGTMRRSNGCRG